ncbi:hypothetical protein acdb102_31480 [Acidothermaceae bacterium B102]|nr:hypothetical protein acdb102_31480 [Acidothermaceae bacterium B102]
MAILPSSARERTRQPVTILRVHGVHGWSSEETLQSLDATQVAGDDLSGFYRRQGDVRAGDVHDGDRREPDGVSLESYSWGGFSSKAPVQALWLLLIPFTLVNLAGWMVRPKRRTAFPDGGGNAAFRAPHPVLARALRLLGLTLTLEFFLGVIAVFVGIIGQQCRDGGCKRVNVGLTWLPLGLSKLSPGLPHDAPARLAVSSLLCLSVLVSLWWLCWLTRRRYERVTRQSAQALVFDQRAALAHPRFWQGDERVLRLSLAHSAAVMGLVAWAAADVRTGSTSKHLELASLALILAAAVSVVWPGLAGLNVVQPASGNGLSIGRLWLVLLSLLGLGLVVRACVHVWNAGVSSFPAKGEWLPPDWRSAVIATGIVQAAVMAFVLVGLWRNRPKDDNLLVPPPSRPQDWTPLSGGFASLGAASLGVGLAAAFTTAAITVAEGAYVTKGKGGDFDLPSVTKTVDAGVLCFLAALGLSLLWQALRMVKTQGQRLWDESAQVAEQPPARPSGWCRPMMRRWVGAVGWPSAKDADTQRLVSIWLGFVVSTAPEILMTGLISGAPWCLAIGILGAAIWPVVPLLHPLVNSQFGTGIAAAGISSFGLLIVGQLAREEKSAESRRTIGVLWDVATFWPRMAHPFAPPCYGERAVPELADRLQWLANDDTSRVILASYSQGTVLASAALLQLPVDVRRRVTLVTLGCPLRRLYARGFPAYFDFPQLRLLTNAQTGDYPEWLNIWRSTDYVGGWIMSNDATVQAPAPFQRCQDQWICDPLTFQAPDGDSTAPPLLAHLNYFPDELVGKAVTALLPPAPSAPEPSLWDQIGSWFSKWF